MASMGEITSKVPIENAKTLRMIRMVVRISETSNAKTREAVKISPGVL
jgi:hypothetical protein